MVSAIRRFFIGLSLVFFAPALGMAETPRIDMGGLIGQLQQGGLVIYFRHGVTDSSKSDYIERGLDRCENQRPLSDEGRAELRQMADVINGLNIPIGSVKSSPFCRCYETADIVFGRYEIAPLLRASAMVERTTAEEMLTYLRAELSAMPEPGTNAVLVGHTTNLNDLTGIWPKPEGVMHVFRPLEGGEFEHVARIKPQDWLDYQPPTQ